MNSICYLVFGLCMMGLVNAKSPMQVSSNEKSSLRVLFEHIDLNADDKLDVSELQYFLHDIEPEDPIPDAVRLEHRMRGIIKPLTSNQEQPYTISWQQFRTKYARLDGLVGKDAPQQIHLALLADGAWSTVIVIWIVKGHPSKQQATSFVQYGKVSGTYTYKQLASNRTYDVGINGWKGMVYEAWMTGLDQCQTYYYRVGNAKDMSSEQSFKTDCPSTTTRTFAVMGDMGTVIPAGFLVAKQMAEDHKKTPFTAVVHVGDISYAGTGSKDELSEIWDVWGEQVEPISSIVPYMTNVGNHEDYYNFTAYRNRFRMPGPESSGVDNFWFSFNTGPVHWVSMSSQHDYAKDSPQYAWLVNDLAKAAQNRQQQPFIIVVTHRPLLCSDASELDQHSPNSPLFQTVYPLFVQYQVQLVITGHMHVYERAFYDNTTTIINNTYTNVHSPVIVVQGTGGSFDNDKWVDPQPWWSKSRSLGYGYGRVTVSVDQTQQRLHYEFLVEHDRSTRDQFSIILK